MVTGMNRDGLYFVRRMFVTGSNSEYEMKKIARAALYCPSLSPKSSFMPAIFALPIFVRLRKARR